ncbi:MAG TPA: membrane dipeptidase [Candidatus Tumulicola sp.]|nr:membrane dipeptidase [Candidatus Tumulicola sp.]
MTESAGPLPALLPYRFSSIPRGKARDMVTVQAERAAAAIARSIVWDNHACMPLRPQDETFLPQLERAAASGVNVIGINVGFGEQTIEDHVRMLAHFRHWVRGRPERYLLVETAADALRAKREGRLGIFFDIEGAAAIDDQLSLIATYYDLGVRWMLIAYNRNNRVGGGCLDRDEGLTEFGRAVIDEMERVGMVLCCSHTGERTALEAIAYARNPPILSHSNPAALWEHPRNVRDRVIEACAAKGGVIGINGVGQFLGRNDTRSATVARNVDYVARLVGTSHVALGLDYVFDELELAEYLKKMPATFPNGAAEPCDFVRPEQLPEIAAELLALGYGHEDLEKILGGNWLRVAQTVWK